MRGNSLGESGTGQIPVRQSATAELRGVSVPFSFSRLKHTAEFAGGRTSCVGATSAADPDMAFCKDEECQP